MDKKILLAVDGSIHMGSVSRYVLDRISGRALWVVS